MQRKFKFANLLVVASFLLTFVACGDGEPTTTTTAPGQVESPTQAANTTADTESPAEAESPTEQMAEGQYDVEFESPFTAETDVYTVAVTGIRFTSREAAIEIFEQEGMNADDFLEADSQTVVGIGITASNTSEEVLQWFPGQATIVFTNEQLETDAFLSEYLAPTDGWQPGIERSGRSVYQSAKSVDEWTSGESLRLLIQSAMNADFEQVGPESEITVEWPDQ